VIDNPPRPFFGTRSGSVSHGRVLGWVHGAAASTRWGMAGSNAGPACVL